VINAATDRRHLLDLDYLRTDRACARGRAAFAAAVVATMRDEYRIAGDK
jgi:hypothetical protein